MGASSDATSVCRHRGKRCKNLITRWSKLLKYCFSSRSIIYRENFEFEWTDGWTEGRAEGWTDRQMDRRTDR